MTLFHKLGDWKIMFKGVNEVLPTEELARMWRYAHLVKFNHDSFGPAWKRNCSQLVR